MTCARAPSTRALLHARHPDLVPGAISADCFYIEETRVCELAVYLGKKDDGSSFSLGARLDEVSFDVSDWVAAVPLLSEEGATSAVLGSAMGRVAGAVQLRSVASYGEWGEADAAAAIHAAVEGLVACRDEGPAPPADMRVVLEVAPDGAVSDVSISRGPYGQTRGDCVNNVLEDLELPPAAGERRISFTLVFYPDAPVPLPYRVIERQAHAAALGVGGALSDRFLRDAVARCYAGVPAAHEAVASYHATLTVQPDGAVGNVNVAGITVPEGVTETVNACITTALERARFACPADGAETTVEATLCLGGR